VPTRAGLPPLRLIVSVDAKLATDDAADPVAEVRAVNVHARQVVDGRDRRQLDHLDFAPRPGGTAENDGWAIGFVHRRDGASAELVILDGTRFSSPPVARVRMRGRVPFGLHGEWLDDEMRSC
jgi:carotenoid cleavage dioxygenase-like enzyme